MLTVVIHQSNLIVAHQPAKVEHQHAPTSGKPGSKSLKLAYILRAVSVKFWLLAASNSLLHDLFSQENPLESGNHILEIGLSPDPPTYISLYPPLWATHPATLLSQFQTPKTPQDAECWLLDELGCTMCLFVGPRDMLSRSLEYRSQAMGG